LKAQSESYKAIVIHRASAAVHRLNLPIIKVHLILDL